MTSRLPRLNLAFARARPDVVPPEFLGRLAGLPERVLQFGEGAFLRGFVDPMIDRLNRAGLFGGRVVVAQPLPYGRVADLNAQDGLYTLLLRGARDGRRVDERAAVTSVSRGIDLYARYDDFLACAANPDLRFIVSNTTEAGIACDGADRPDDAPPASFPGKLTALLHARFRHFRGDAGKGFVLLPCELIERNGDALRRCVIQTAGAWGLGRAFGEWVERANIFANTLVDRIVTGYPADEAAALADELGYEDALMDAAEPFQSWVIEAPPDFGELSRAAGASELPFDRAGLDVRWVDDLTPFRERKVRILNGAHTLLSAVGLLAPRRTVKDCINDPVIGPFLLGAIHEEILPTLDLPRAELEWFAAAVLERFANPFLRHELLGIALNAAAKFRVRVLPSLLEYHRRTGALPRRLTFGLAALVALYGGDMNVRDDPAVLALFREAWAGYAWTAEGTETMTRKVLRYVPLWGEDLTKLPGLAGAISDGVFRILADGAYACMAKLVEEAK